MLITVNYNALCWEGAEKDKSCGIGYALAASSCEGVGSVDACTVAVPDAITAFAVPNLNCSSQSQLVFSGLVARRVASPSGSPSLLRIGECYLDQPFPPSTIATIAPVRRVVNAGFWCIRKMEKAGATAMHHTAGSETISRPVR